MSSVRTAGSGVPGEQPEGWRINPEEEKNAVNKEQPNTLSLNIPHHPLPTSLHVLQSRKTLALGGV